MVTNTLDYCVGAGVTDRKAFTGKTGGEQLTTGCAIQTGIADDDRVFRPEQSVVRRSYRNAPSGHAFADVVVLGRTGVNFGFRFDNPELR